METTRYTLSASHMTHDRFVEVVDTQPEDPAERVVKRCHDREEAFALVARLNNEFAAKAREMNRRGLHWLRAYKSWAWLRPYN